MDIVHPAVIRYMNGLASVDDEPVLLEMEAEGKVGAVASRHLSFTGPIMELSTLRIDTGPAAAKLLINDGVDVVLLTPV